MKSKHLMVIDPAIKKPAIESYNRIALSSPFAVTYHLPAIHGTTSIKQIQGDISGIIVMGSASSVHDNSNWKNFIIELLVKSIDCDVPVMGICYGHQLLAYICGGKVGHLWGGKKEQGCRNVQLKENPLWGQAMSGPMIFSHQEGVTQCPDDFKITAVSDMVCVDGFASKTKPIWGFQTHIEATKAFINDHDIQIENPKGAFDFGHQILDNFIQSLI